MYESSLRRLLHKVDRLCALMCTLVCPDSSLLKDVVVFISLTTTTLLMCYAYKVRQKAQQQVAKMMTDVESLQQAERELKSLQERFTRSVVCNANRSLD